MHAVVPYEVRSSETQGLQTSPANGSVQLDLPSMFFLTALPFADVSILSHKGEPAVDHTDIYEPAVDHTDIYESLKDSLGNKNLKVGHINVNGIINKLNEVHVLLNEVKWDILGITETHLTASTPDNLLRIPGYDFVRKDRSCSSKGGGVLIYYHKCLTVHQDLKWDIQELEAVWINVTLHSQSTLIGCLYRPPKDMTFFSSLQALLNQNLGQKN